VIGFNVLMPFLSVSAVETAAARLRYVEFFYGDPVPDLVARVHAHGALAAWQVGSADEAVAAEEAGCDFVIAQGVEAGGHLRGTTALLPLLDEVLDAVRVPVVAAGGIATARGVAAVLTAGADAARIGTRFLATPEADVHPDYRDALLAARAEDTVLTETFSATWPNAPHRVLRPCIDTALTLSADTVGAVAFGDRQVPLPRLARRRQCAPRQGTSPPCRTTRAKGWGQSPRSVPQPRSCGNWPTAQRSSSRRAPGTACRSDHRHHCNPVNWPAAAGWRSSSRCLLCRPGRPAGVPRPGLEPAWRSWPLSAEVGAGCAGRGEVDKSAQQRVAVAGPVGEQDGDRWRAGQRHGNPLKQLVAAVADARVG
jgi:nitronate monooxygenase